MTRRGRVLAAKAWGVEFKSQHSLEKPGLAMCPPNFSAVAARGMKTAGAAGRQSSSRLSEKLCLKAIL